MKLVKSFDEGNNFENAIIPLSLNIEEVDFLYRHEIETKKLEWVKRVINKHKNIKVKFIRVNEENIDKYIDENTIVDVSASKYLSLVLCEIALKENKQIIYYDGEERCIKDYKKHVILNDKMFRFDIEDIITLNGGKIISNLHEAVKDKDTIDLIYKTIDNTCDNYGNFIAFVSRINSYLNGMVSNNGTYLLNNKTIDKIISDNNYNKFNQLGLFTINGNKISFYNEDIRKLFTVSGTFLENYIYNKLIESKAFDDVKMSVKIEFSNEQKIPVTCELDCLVLKDNTLLFTSIKSNKVDPDDLNEIKVHNVMFGNRYSKPVICIYNELSETRPAVYAKAQELGVYVIEECDFKAKIIDSFENIINNSYTYQHIM